MNRQCRSCGMVAPFGPDDAMESCPSCGAAYGPVTVGLDRLANESEAEAPGWPTTMADINRAVRSAAGLTDGPTSTSPSNVGMNDA